MNRRDALKALVSLPEVARISVGRLKPNDVIVIEVARPITLEAVDRIRCQVQLVWSDRKVVVLQPHMTMKVVEGTEA